MRQKDLTKSEEIMPAIEINDYRQAINMSSKTQILEKVTKSKAELFGILASVSTKLEELNDADLRFVLGNVYKAFEPPLEIDPGTFVKGLNDDKK